MNRFALALFAFAACDGTPAALSVPADAGPVADAAPMASDGHFGADATPDAGAPCTGDCCGQPDETFCGDSGSFTVCADVRTRTVAERRHVCRSEVCTPVTELFDRECGGSTICVEDGCRSVGTCRDRAMPATVLPYEDFVDCAPTAPPSGLVEIERADISEASRAFARLLTRSQECGYSFLVGGTSEDGRTNVEGFVTNDQTRVSEAVFTHDGVTRTMLLHGGGQPGFEVWVRLWFTIDDIDFLAAVLRIEPEVLVNELSLGREGLCYGGTLQTRHVWGRRSDR